MRYIKELGICAICTMMFNTSISQIALYPIEGKKGESFMAGYIDSQGKVVIEPSYGRAEQFEKNGMAIVYKDQGYGIINAKNEFVLEPNYTSIQWYEDQEMYFVREKDGTKYFWSPHQSKITINPMVSNARSFSNGYFKVTIDKKVGFYNSDNELIIPADYETVGYLPPFENGYVTLKKGEDYFVFNSKGEVVLKTEHTIVRWNGQGLIPFKDSKTRKKGYLNLKGEVVVPAEYSSVMDFENGYGKIVKDKNEPIILNTQGKKVSEEDYLTAQKIKYVLAKDPKTKKDGIKSRDGKVLIALKYSKVEEQKNGMFLCRYKQTTNSMTELHLYDKKFKLVRVVKNLWYQTAFHGELVKFYVYEKASASSRVREVYMNTKGKIVWQGELNWPECFPEESLITMKDGSQKRISEIADGDEVLSYDIATNSMTSSRVSQLDIHHGSYDLSSINLGSQNDMLVYNGALNTAGNVIISSTESHPFYTTTGVKTMHNLDKRDKLICYNSEGVVEESLIFKTDKLRTVLTVYNLQVEAGNYFVNGVLVLVK